MIVVLIMVKNEATNIAATLDTYSSCHRIYLFDTGSEDQTIQVASNWAHRHHIDFRLTTQAFVDYATSRNQALEWVRGCETHARYCLFIDAEWYLEGWPTLVSFVEGLETSLHRHEVHRVWLHSGTRVLSVRRLIYLPGKAHFYEPVHEVCRGQLGPDCPKTCFFRYAPSSQGRAKTLQRLHHDIELLTPGAEAGNPRHTFYLARSYHSLGQIEVARKWYLARSAMLPGGEEVYLSFLRVAQMSPTTEALMYYNLAAAARPSRIEALVGAASVAPTPHLQYMYSHLACQLPESNDILFVEPRCWTTHRWRLLAQSATAMKLWKEAWNALTYIPLDSTSGQLIAKITAHYTPEVKVRLQVAVLYSPDPEYDLMAQIQIINLQAKKLPFFLYYYTSEVDTPTWRGHYLLLPGQETYAGITAKTLTAFQWALQYSWDYLVRINVSTMIDWDLIRCLLQVSNLKYGGPWTYARPRLNPSGGACENNQEAWENRPFVSGCCIVLNRVITHRIVNNISDILALHMMDDLALGVWCHQQGIPMTTLCPKNEIMFRHKSPQRRTDIRVMNLKIKNLCYPRCVVKMLTHNDSPVAHHYLDLYHLLEGEGLSVAEVGAAKKEWTVLALMLAAKGTYYYYDSQDNFDKSLAQSLDVQVIIDLQSYSDRTTIRGHVVFINGPATHHFVSKCLTQAKEAKWIIVSHAHKWWNHDHPEDRPMWGGDQSGYKYLDLRDWKRINHNSECLVLNQR